MTELLIFLLAAFTSGAFFQSGAMAVMHNGSARLAATNLMVSMVILVCVGSYAGYLFGFDQRDRRASSTIEKAQAQIKPVEPSGGPEGIRNGKKGK